MIGPGVTAQPFNTKWREYNSMAKFTSRIGIHLAGTDDKGKQVHEPIAFKYDAEATGSASEKVYSADVDAAGAKALKALDKKVLDEYGIVEAKAEKPEGSEKGRKAKAEKPEEPEQSGANEKPED